MFESQLVDTKHVLTSLRSGLIEQRVDMSDTGWCPSNEDEEILTKMLFCWNLSLRIHGAFLN